MADDTVAPADTAPPGQAWIKSLQDKGLPDASIQEMKRQRTQDALNAGVPQTEIDHFFGEQPSRLPEALTGVARDNLTQAGHDPATMDKADPNSWNDLFWTGFGNSALSLEYGNKPTKELPPPEQMGWFGSFLSSAGQMVGDFPAGFSASAATGLATKNPVIAAYAFNAAPEAIRQAYIAKYNTGKPVDLWQIIKSVNDAGVVGMAGGKAGDVAGKYAADLAGKYFAPTAATLVTKGTEATAMALASTSAAGALNGHLPTATDFTTGAAFAILSPLGFKGAKAIADWANPVGRVDLTGLGQQAKARMEAIYAKTGVHPTEAAKAAANTPILRETLLGSNSEGEAVTKPWEEVSKSDPPPVKKPTEEVKPPTAETKPVVEEHPVTKEPIVKIDPMERVGALNPDTGIGSVKSMTPDQFSHVVDLAREQSGQRLDPGLVDDPKAHGEYLKGLADRAGKYKLADGSIDLEASLIDEISGPGVAIAFRNTGRDVSKLPKDTQRFLEAAGHVLEAKGGYEPNANPDAAPPSDGEPPKPLAGEGGGGSKEPPGGAGGPPPPIVPDPNGGMNMGPKPPGEEPHFPRDPQFTAEDINKDVRPAYQGNKWSDMWRSAKSGAWWRELAPATSFDKMVGLSKDEKAIGLEDLLRLAYASSGRTKARIHYGGIEMKADNVGSPYYAINKDVPSMASIMTRAAKLPNGGMERFRAFMQSLDTLDREKLGLDTTTDPGKARDHLVAEAGDRTTFKEMNAMAKDYQAMMRDTLKGLVFSGRMNEAQVKGMTERHPNWFPQKVAVEGTDTNATSKRVGPGGGKTIFKAEGHEHLLQDQFFSTLDDIDKREKFNSINIARRFAVEQLQQHFGEVSNSRDLVIAKPPKEPGTAVATNDTAWKHGIIDDKGDVKLDDSKFFEHNPNEIHYWEDGKPMSYKVPDFEGRGPLMDMIMSPSLIQQDFVKGWLGMAARGERMLIADTPKFIARVMFQDSFQAAVLSKYGGIPMWNTIQGGLRVIDHITGGKLGGKLDEEWKRYEMNGGYNMSLLDMNSNKTLELFNSLERTGYYGALKNGVSHPIDAFRQFFRNTDAMTRSTVFANAEKSLGTIKGAVESRLVHGDFSERSAKANGETMNFIAAVTPFFRAKMRGFIDAGARSLAKDPTGVGMRAAAFLVVPSLMFQAYNYYFDKQHEGDTPADATYHEISKNEKDVSWHIPFIDTHGNVSRIRLPVPFEIGQVVNGATQRFVKQWYENDPNAFHGYIKHLMERTLTSDIPIVQNPVLKSAVEGVTGVDLFTHRPIIPARLEHLSAKNQVLPWTTDSAKTVAGMINSVTGGNTVSPVGLEHFTRTWTGDLGPAILQTLDKGTGPIPGMNKNEQAHDWANDPWVGSFVLRNPGMNSQTISDFYDAYTAAQKAKGDIKVAQKTGSPEDRIAAMSNVDARVNLDQAAKALSKMRSVVYAIESNAKMSPDDKRQNIDVLVNQMIQVSKMALTRWEAAHGGKNPTAGSSGYDQGN